MVGMLACRNYQATAQRGEGGTLFPVMDRKTWAPCTWNQAEFLVDESTLVCHCARLWFNLTSEGVTSIGLGSTPARLRVLSCKAAAKGRMRIC